MLCLLLFARGWDFSCITLLNVCRMLVMERLRGVPLTDLAAIQRVTDVDPESILVNALNTWFGSVLSCETFHADMYVPLPRMILLFPVHSKWLSLPISCPRHASEPKSSHGLSGAQAINEAVLFSVASPKWSVT